LKKLLEVVISAKGDDQVLILSDSKTNDGTDINPETFAIIEAYKGTPRVDWILHSLDKNYGAHKNFGIERCYGDFIFQIDGDELPPEALLGENLHALLESNPTIEAYAVPRINDFRGVTDAHAKQWGWRLTTSPTYNRPVVNWPDYQWRIFKRDYPRISFTRRLHEKIEGYGANTVLPSDEEYALYHDKTIETQVKTNLRYNQLFTQEENKGHSVFR
jgi:glycosyltransferase involved in cell wall biosynthesis